MFKTHAAGGATCTIGIRPCAVNNVQSVIAVHSATLPHVDTRQMPSAVRERSASNAISARASSAFARHWRRRRHSVQPVMAMISPIRNHTSPASAS